MSLKLGWLAAGARGGLSAFGNSMVGTGQAGYSNATGSSLTEAEAPGGILTSWKRVRERQRRAMFDGGIEIAGGGGDVVFAGSECAGFDWPVWSERPEVTLSARIASDGS